MTPDVPSGSSEPSTVGPDAADLGTLGTFAMDDGATLVIYDRHIIDAWLSSTTVQTLEEMR